MTKYYCMRCKKKIRFWQTPIFFESYFDNGYNAIVHPVCANEKFKEIAELTGRKS